MQSSSDWPSLWLNLRSSQRYRRCDICNNTKVKYKEMSCQCRYSHTYQDRSTGCCHDTVIGSGRYTHTKYDTAQHSQKQCDDQFSVCNTDDSVDQVIGKSCHGDGTGMIPATPQATATEITPLPPASSASIHLVTLILFSLSKRLTITERTIA